MNVEQLMEVIGEVNDYYVEETLTYKAPFALRAAKWIKRCAAVACACLIIVFSPILLNFFGFNSEGPKGDAPNEENMPESPNVNANPLDIGETYVFTQGIYNGTRFYYKSYKDNTLTIELNKKDFEEIHLYFSGNEIRDEWIDINGKPAYDLTHYYASTDPNFSEDYGERIENAFVITVNGKNAEALPKKAGIYEITIDLSIFANYCNDFEPYLIWSYGALYIDEIEAKTPVVEEEEEPILGTVANAPSYVSYVGGKGDEAMNVIWQISENKEEDREEFLPVVLIENNKELKDFQEVASSEFRLDEKRESSNESFLSVCEENFDGKFFETSSLLIVGIIATSGSYVFSLENIYLSEEKITAKIREDLEGGGIATCDMAAWFISIVINKTDYNENTSFSGLM